MYDNKKEVIFIIKRSENYLQHHGIKGMKWGIRRYQNKDGSLTPEGKKRLTEKSGFYLNPPRDANYKTIKNRKEVAEAYQVAYKKLMEKYGLGSYRGDGYEMHRELEKRGRYQADDKLWNSFIRQYTTATLKDLKLKDSTEARAYVQSLFEKELVPIQKKDKSSDIRDNIYSEANKRLQELRKSNANKEQQKEAITKYYKTKVAELDSQGEGILADHIWYGDYINLLDDIDYS